MRFAQKTASKRVLKCAINIPHAQGEPCYKTWSMGAFVDKASGKLKRVDEGTMASLLIEPQLPMNYRDRRIILPKQGGQPCQAFRVMKADIDYNRHMNNANYLRMAMELLPDDFQARNLRMEYRVPAKLGDSLTPIIYRPSTTNGVGETNSDDSTFIVSLSLNNPHSDTGSDVSAIIEFSL